MKKGLLIIGAGGHGRVVADTARLCGYKEVFFLDDAESLSSKTIGKVCEYEKYLNTYDFFVAIGNNSVRKKITKELKERGASIATLIHPSAVIGSNVSIECGSFVAPMSVVNTGAKIGESVIINTSASVDHDCVVSDYAHVSVGARIAGTTSVGSGCFVSAGATLINNISVCAECVIGAGAVVIRNIDDPGTYVGIPASRIKTL